MMQDRRQTIRPGFAVGVVCVVLAGWLGIHEVQVAKQIRSLREERQQLIEKQETFRVQHAEASVEDFQVRPASQPLQVGSTDGNSQDQKRIAALESRIRELQTAAQRRPIGPVVPEYDPTNPQAQEPATPLEGQTNAVPMRQWGTEQVLGAPNTDHGGDIPTAWASREPDAGPEWLAVGFERVVEVAEVRIRETFNPGAISKVTAIVDGREVVLWEGIAAGGTAPRDFVLPVSVNVRSDSIVVHLDTARVAGWNEIDAVELVGRDGSRQWATAANASSTYAEPQPPR